MPGISGIRSSCSQRNAGTIDRTIGGAGRAELGVLTVGSGVLTWKAFSLSCSSKNPRKRLTAVAVYAMVRCRVSANS